MKKKTKTSKPAKKPVKKAAPKKAAAKKPVKKAAPKKAVKKVAKKVAKKVVKKAAPKKAVSKKPVKKAAPQKPVAKKAAKKTAPKKAVKKTVAKKPAAKAASKSFVAKMQKAVVTTVLPPKLGNARIASSALPSQAAVKAPKAPQAKLAVGSPAASGNARKRLNKDELKFFENLLNEKKETLLQEQSYLEDNALRLNSKEGAGDLSSHAYHLADHATETQDREQAFHLASREGKFLYYIEEALDRVRAGTFGICKRCGVLIPKARLEAVPTAKMCINCKSMQEHAVAEDAA